MQVWIGSHSSLIKLANSDIPVLAMFPCYFGLNALPKFHDIIEMANAGTTSK